MTSPNKVDWIGKVIAVQPRIRLTRSFDQSSHTYQGYVLRVDGRIGDEHRAFLIAIGEGAQAKHDFVVGDGVSGKGVRVRDARLETAELYKNSGLKRFSAEDPSTTSPPWHGIPPTLPEYRERGHRRLARADLRHEVFGVPLGLSDGGRDDHRSLEPQSAPVSNRDLLLWPTVVPSLQAWPQPKGPWTQGHAVRGGRLGR